MSERPKCTATSCVHRIPMRRPCPRCIRALVHLDPYTGRAAARRAKEVRR